MKASWDSERIERMTLLWRAGKSAGEIALEFGDVSRNAVIGRLHRSGLRDDAREHRRSHGRSLLRVAKPHPTPKRRRRAIQKSRNPEIQKSLRAEIEAPTPTIDDADIPLAQRRDLDRLDGRCCHWPVGDPLAPGFFFCGGPVNDGAPYCPAHMARAHGPTSPLNVKGLVRHGRR